MPKQYGEKPHRVSWDAYLTPPKLFAPSSATQHPTDESQHPLYMKHYNPHMLAQGCSVGIITAFGVGPPCSIAASGSFSLRVNMTRRWKKFYWIEYYQDEVIQDEARRRMFSNKYF